MTQYNTFNLKLCNALLNKLKSGIKNGIEIKKILSSNVISHSLIKHIFLVNYY